MHEITYEQNQELYAKNEVGLCDEPHGCESCTEFLHKTKSLLMSEWYIDNLKEEDVYSIQLGTYIDDETYQLLKTDNFYEIMNSIHARLPELQKVEFHKKDFLFHSRLRTDWLGNCISVEFEVFFPPIDSIPRFNFFEDLNKNIQFNHSYKKEYLNYELDDFDSPNLKVKLFAVNEYKEIIPLLREKLSGNIECDIEEVIYLHTLGTYKFRYNKNTGFSCEFLKINKENILSIT